MLFFVPLLVTQQSATKVACAEIKTYLVFDMSSLISADNRGNLGATRADAKSASEFATTAWIRPDLCCGDCRFAARYATPRAR